MKNLFLVFCIGVFLVLGCGGNSASQNSNPMANSSIEEKLVFLDTNKIPKPEDTKVKRVSYLLDYLAENTTSSRNDIAETANGTVDAIKNRYGKDYTRQDVLEGGKRIIDAIPASKRGKKDDFNSIAFLIVMEASK